MSADPATLMQWRAFEACCIDHLTQAQAALRFGVSQQAISRRIRRYRERTLGRGLAEISPYRTRQLMRKLSLSLAKNV